MNVELFPPPPPEGLVVHNNWLDSAACSSLLASIDQQPWIDELARRVQHYGWRYSYTSRGLQRENRIGPIPPLFDSICAKAEILMGGAVEQVIVNEYQVGQGIAQHIDSLDFGPVVCSLSLGDEWPLDLRHADNEPYEVRLPVGSLVMLSGEARYAWSHGIAPRKRDVLHRTQKKIERRHRQRRVSVTMRTIAEKK